MTDSAAMAPARSDRRLCPRRSTGTRARRPAAADRSSARPGAARPRRRSRLAILSWSLLPLDRRAGRPPARPGRGPGGRALTAAAPPVRRRAARRADRARLRRHRRGRSIVARPLRLAARPGALARLRLPVVLGDRRLRAVALPRWLLTAPVGPPDDPLVDGGGWWWVFLLFLAGPMLVAWWLVTPALVRARALAERGILGHSRVERARAAGRPRSRRPGPRHSTTRPPRSAGSSATCTTAPRPGSQRSA